MSSGNMVEMPQTNIYRRAGIPISYYGITYVFKEKERSELRDVRTRILEGFGDRLLMATEDTLHITVMKLVPSSNYGGKSEEAEIFYKGNENTYIRLLSRVADEATPFRIRFSTVEASKDAVIIRAKDDGSMESIRRKLSVAPRLGAKEIDYDFVHSTQGRYAKEMPLKEAEHLARDIEVDVEITVDRISLVHADVAFTKPFQVLRSFDLRKE